MEYTTLPVELERKTLPLVEVKVDGTGTFLGRASTFDSVDSYGDSVAPGAYAKTLPSFLSRGFIAWGHDWNQPIAMPVAAEERADGLYIEAKFHSDTQAQMYRTRAKERVDAGLFMGLSIGFQAKSWHHEGDVRVLDEIDLYEVSLVTVPAERNAGLVTVKGYGISYEEHAEQLRAAVEDWTARCKTGLAKRSEEKVGRVISAARAALIASVSGSLRAHADELDSLIAAKTDEEPEEPEGEQKSKPEAEPEIPADETPETGEESPPEEDKAELIAIKKSLSEFASFYGLAGGN